MSVKPMLAGACALLALAGAVEALDEVALQVERASGAGWSAKNIAVSLDLPRQGVQVSIAQLHVGALSRTLRDVSIECPRLELSDTEILCPRARVVLRWPGIGGQALQARLRYGRRDGSLDFAVTGLQLASGSAAVEASLRPQGWVLRTRLQRVPLETLRQVLGDLAIAPVAASMQGLITLSGSARGSGGTLQHAVFDASLSELAANNESGSIASDRLALRLKGSLDRAGSDWQFALALEAGQGQAYVQPIFLDFAAHPLSATAEGRLSAREVTVERFAVDHVQVSRASGRARIDLAERQPLRSLHLQLASLEFPGAYASYLQPLLLETGFKAAKTAGSVAGEIAIDSGAVRSIDLTLHDVSLDDGTRKVALSQLRGAWHWSAEALPGAVADAVQPSRLEWRDGALLGLELGAGKLEFQTQGRQLRLLEPTRIPLLDGAVALESLRIRNAGLPQVAFMVDATIEPVSVQQLCRAFGWPEFGGHLGGVVSKLRMRDGVLTLGTTLEAQVFDGRVTLKDLKLEEPFGQWPRFSANLALDNLDLELVTRAFSFGRITGRLSGAVDGLELFNWVPVAFDARFHTPLDDRSRHRISQRAVRNIGSVGGSAGVGAALSSGFLRFFDDFNYDRLGWTCRLQREVCVMDGVAAAPDGGYYLVKGKGLPRIDVIGSARRVDWPRLVQQLIAVTRSEGPVIE